jgi:hypothetical protein
MAGERLRMNRSRLLLAAALGLAPVAALAEPAPPHSVSPVVVPGGPPPQVKATYPAQGAAVPDGVMILKVTFDVPMTPDAWAYGKDGDAAFPQCLARPRLLNDQRTFVLLCTVEPGAAYAVAINAAPRFANASGRSAAPYVLKFTTTDVDTRDLPTALSQAGLTEQDDPIMNWRDDGKGISQTPEPQ